MATGTDGRKGTIEQRDFKMHEKLLVDVIKRQAGSIEKAILEGVMNSIEAGATRVDVTVQPRAIEIADDGRGFRSRHEIETFFETFGQPHDASEGKRWAQFRMGRGQLFAFGRNEWRTGHFRMLVDINQRLGYDLEELAERAAGCRVRVTLYDPIGDRAIYSIAREVGRYVKYVEVPVAVNGVLVNTPASESKWGPESTDNGWIKLTESGHSLEVYNLGVWVCGIPRHVYGVSGVIVSRQRLDVNFARNDVIRSCPVWRKITAGLEGSDRVRKIKTKRALTDSERLNVIGRLAGGEMRVKDLRQTQLFVDCSGHPWSVDAIRKAGWPSFTTAPRGSAKGDKLLQAHLALVLDEDQIAAFPCDPAEVFTHKWPQPEGAFEWESALGAGHEREMPPYISFEAVSATVTGSHVIVPEKAWTRTERVWQQIAVDLQVQIAGDWGKRRRIMIGSSDCFEGWTDGHSFIALSREYLTRLTLKREDRPVVESLSLLANLIAHEQCHDSDSATDLIHAPEFYRDFHELQNARVPHAVGGVYRALCNGRLLRLLGKGDAEPAQAPAEPVAVAAQPVAAEPPIAAPEPPATDAEIKPGKVLVNKDRGGKERCRCTLRDDGQVDYNGKVYKSLSAAGLQAMRDLGLKSPTCDGPAFWGLKTRSGRAAA